MLKKDIFKGKVKKEYVSYLLVTIILMTTLGVGLGGAFLYVGVAAYLTDPSKGAVVLGVVGAAIFAYGVLFCIGAMLSAREYPKYERIRKWLWNSDCYFTECNTKEYRGTRRGRLAFEVATQAAERNALSEGVKLPRSHTIYTVLAIVSGVMEVASIVGMVLLGANDAICPVFLQDDRVLCLVFVPAMLISLFLMLFFVIQGEKVKENAIMEHLEKTWKDEGDRS